jgi:hypothetical protein
LTPTGHNVILEAMIGAAWKMVEQSVVMSRKAELIAKPPACDTAIQGRDLP